MKAIDGLNLTRSFIRLSTTEPNQSLNIWTQDLTSYKLFFVLLSTTESEDRGRVSWGELSRRRVVSFVFSKPTHVKNRTLSNFFLCMFSSFTLRKTYFAFRREKFHSDDVTYKERWGSVWLSPARENSKIEQQPIRDATRISVHLRHHVGIFGSALEEKECKRHPGNIRDISDIPAVHAFIINDLFTFLLQKTILRKRKLTNIAKMEITSMCNTNFVSFLLWLEAAEKKGEQLMKMSLHARHKSESEEWSSQ